MADLKIYNNGENKILFSAGDRIIRQPYEFGKCYMRESNQFIDFDVSGLITRDITLCFWLKNQGFTIPILMYDDLGNEVIRLEITADDRHRIVELNSIKTNGIISSPSNSFKVFKIDSDGNANFGANGGFGYNTPVTVSDYTIKTIRVLGVGGVDYLVLFDRFLSKSEYLFIYNNGLGSYPQLLLGALIFADFNGAYILNNGTSDFVGVKNEIGINTHGVLNNLPAGTLQEQLDWANANLFVPFIS